MVCRSLPAERYSRRSPFDLSVDLRPALNSTRHRRDVFVPHLLHRQGGERRAVSARTVHHYFLFPVDERLDFRLEIAARDVNGARKAPEIPFVRLSHIEIDGNVVARLHVT